MAKRNRGAVRPGQRPADRSSAKLQTRPNARPNGGLSDTEEARAAELESQIVAQSRTAESSRANARDLSRSADMGRAVRPRGQGTLAIRAAEEYGYVARDVRRIIYVGGFMVALLAVLFVLIDVAKVIKL